MSIAELAKSIGKTGSLSTSGLGLRFNVTIKDVRSAFGRIDFLVTPEKGSGETWVSSDRVSINK